MVIIKEEFAARKETKSLGVEAREYKKKVIHVTVQSTIYLFTQLRGLEHLPRCVKSCGQNQFSFTLLDLFLILFDFFEFAC